MNGFVKHEEIINENIDKENKIGGKLLLTTDGGEMMKIIKDNSIIIF